MNNRSTLLPPRGMLLDAEQPKPGAKPEAALTDQDIARIFALTPHYMTLQFMEHYADLIQDDNNYWNFLGTAWKAGGCFADQERWIVLFKKDRRNPRKIMKASERREFSRLPKKVIAYRAYKDVAEIEQSICWSIDQKFVQDYAAKKGYRVAKLVFSSSDIFAYFNRRNESEILVWRSEAN